MLHSGALRAVVEALMTTPWTSGAQLEMRAKVQANLIGTVLNCALNPSCKGDILDQGVMKALLEAVTSEEVEVQTLASTAIAYLSDKSEHRPGSPNSTMTSADSPAKFTQRKMRFHDSSRPSTVDEQAAVRPSSPHK